MENKDYFKIVKERVLNQLNGQEYKLHFKGSEQMKVDQNHFLEVVEIVKDLWNDHQKGKSPAALEIAALCHDMDRIYPKRCVNTKDYPKGQYMFRKGVHVGTTALIFYELNQDLPNELLHDVCFLILRHEVGGDRNSTDKLTTKNDEFSDKYNLNEAADLLWIADKLSFFKSNIFEYKNRGKEKLMKKIEFSLNGLPDYAKKKILNRDYGDELINECILEFLK